MILIKCSTSNCDMTSTDLLQMKENLIEIIEEIVVITILESLLDKHLKNSKGHRHKLRRLCITIFECTVHYFLIEDFLFHRRFYMWFFTVENIM